MAIGIYVAYFCLVGIGTAVVLERRIAANEERYRIGTFYLYWAGRAWGSEIRHKRGANS